MLAGAWVIFCSKPEALTTVSPRVTGDVWAVALRLLNNMAPARTVRA